MHDIHASDRPADTELVLYVGLCPRKKR